MGMEGGGGMGGRGDEGVVAGVWREVSRLHGCCEGGKALIWVGFAVRVCSRCWEAGKKRNALEDQFVIVVCRCTLGM